MVSNYIYFNSRDELLRIDLKRVAYFEADGNYTKIVSINGLSSMVLLNLGKMEAFISLRSKEENRMFARIGKRFIVNLSFIYSLNLLKQELILSDQRFFTEKISISKDALKKLKELLSPSIAKNEE